MSCWHAAARMLWAFKYRQSINPLPKLFQANTGLSDWTWIAEKLRTYGPLWAAGMWYGFGHAVVITGVYPDGTLFVNDPGSGKKVHDVQWFNEKLLSNIKHPIMYLPSHVANDKGYMTYIGESM